MAAVGWSQTMPSCEVLVGSGARLQYSPVWLLLRATGSPGAMLGSLALVGLVKVNCSGAVVPVPLPAVAGAVLLSTRTGPLDVKILMSVLVAMVAPGAMAVRFCVSNKRHSCFSWQRCHMKRHARCTVAAQVMTLH